LPLTRRDSVRVCSEDHITMCGVTPSAVMMIAAKQLGATKAGQVDYSTSGDVTGDSSQVVAYLSVAIT